jgi:hypothetical protein
VRAAAGSADWPAARAPARASSPGRAAGDRRRRTGGSGSTEATRRSSIAEISAAAMVSDRRRPLYRERSRRRIYALVMRGFCVMREIKRGEESACDYRRKVMLRVVFFIYHSYIIIPQLLLGFVFLRE